MVDNLIEGHRFRAGKRRMSSLARESRNSQLEMQRIPLAFPCPPHRNPCRPLRRNKVRFAIPSTRFARCVSPMRYVRRSLRIPSSLYSDTRKMEKNARDGEREIGRRRERDIRYASRSQWNQIIRRDLSFAYRNNASFLFRVYNVVYKSEQAGNRGGRDCIRTYLCRIRRKPFLECISGI